MKTNAKLFLSSYNSNNNKKHIKTQRSQPPAWNATVIDDRSTMATHNKHTHAYKPNQQRRQLYTHTYTTHWRSLRANYTDTTTACSCSCSYTQHTLAEAYSDLTDTKWTDRHYTTSKPDTCMDVCMYIRIKQTNEQAWNCAALVARCL